MGRIKHDLGKYVAFQIRWLAADASLTERAHALRQDLLATRRGPEGEQDAPSLWRGFRPALVGEEPLPGGAVVDLSADRDVTAIDAAMAEIEAVVRALRLDAADDETVARGVEAALRVADAARDLARRVRQRGS